MVLDSAAWSEMILGVRDKWNLSESQWMARWKLLGWGARYHSPFKEQVGRNSPFSWYMELSVAPLVKGVGILLENFVRKA